MQGIGANGVVCCPIGPAAGEGFGGLRDEGPRVSEALPHCIHFLTIRS
jgi:hypothetical protein